MTRTVTARAMSARDGRILTALFQRIPGPCGDGHHVRVAGDRASLIWCSPRRRPGGAPGAVIHTWRNGLRMFGAPLGDRHVRLFLRALRALNTGGDPEAWVSARIRPSCWDSFNPYSWEHTGPEYVAFGPGPGTRLVDEHGHIDLSRPVLVRTRASQHTGGLLYPTVDFGLSGALPTAYPVFHALCDRPGNGFRASTVAVPFETTATEVSADLPAPSGVLARLPADPDGYCSPGMDCDAGDDDAEEDNGRYYHECGECGHEFSSRWETQDCPRCGSESEGYR